MTDLPITRTLRLCFEVTAHFNPLSESDLQRTPELAAWQEALLSRPEIVDHILVSQALANFHDHIRGIEESEWGVQDPFDLLLSLPNFYPTPFSLGVLYSALSGESETEYLEPLWSCLDTERDFRLHVFEGDRRIEWEPDNPIAILEHDREHGFLFANLHGATTLVLYLEKTGASQAALNRIAAEAEKCERPFQQALALAATDSGQIDPLAESLILEHLQIAFPNLPVQVRCTPRRTFEP